MFGLNDNVVNTLKNLASEIDKVFMTGVQMMVV